MDTGTLIFNWVFLIGALIVLPLSYVGVLVWLNKARLVHPPQSEFFVAFGTLGGLFLAFAFSPSPLAALCAAFTYLVSFPVSLFYIFRLMSRRAPKSRYHRFALMALCCGLLLPFLLFGLAWLLSWIQNDGVSL